MESWQLVLIGAAVAWFTYQVGKRVGREEQKEWDQLKRQIDLETDPEKKLELQFKWAEAIDDPRFREAFKAALEVRKRNLRSSTRQR